MIKNAPLLTIKRRFSRPLATEVAAFAGQPTGFVADALGGRGALHGRANHRVRTGGRS
jgi:4-hydroxy-4-methyl-2-oxoglutarate aldolase